MQLASFSPHCRNGLAEEAARDPLAYAFLLHSLSSVDYSHGLPGATGLRWPESRLHAELCRALAQRVLFTDSGAYRMPARVLCIDILGNPKAAGGVHAILGMRPKAFAAAMSSVTGDAFAPAKALGNMSTYVRARTVLDAGAGDASAPAQAEWRLLFPAAGVTATAGLRLRLTRRAASPPGLTQAQQAALKKLLKREEGPPQTAGIAGAGEGTERAAATH